ncbi:DUF4226 domain-containing protein [Mycobacterium sp. 852002-40037_SCH5390672]|uniref:DUF4226 domain-containing protein n=1 Tax=Mycobacterium sp. 852002-40037_SCH5390672 TaxID=1834089 RepID=UPI0008049D35|nr:DUF4226 domain-containing protein [Mycobacterium sp. 852002-40037_SCH5390672]OBB96616.1 hypothetical protein A5782_03560 [Mycobacterium sp. 852002-40037_SCH5390672]
MSAYDDLLAAVKYVRDRTGDPNAWQTGLAPAEVTAVITPTTRPEQVEAILRKIRQQHAGVFGAGTTANPPASRPSDETPPPPDRETGEAADAIAHAEAALAQQNSASSQLDMQVVSAILNAHLRAVDGREALTKLQHETEAAVRIRSDLDTPAGARDFQRFLIGKLRDIREVVLNASLDDTSKSALMAAWTSLYDASKGEPKSSGEQPRAAVPVGDAPAADDPDSEWDPLLDSLLGDDDGLLSGDVAGMDPAAVAAPPAPPQSVAPAMPTFGGGSLPGLGSLPASMAGWEGPGGLLSGLRGGDGTDPALDDLADEDLPGDQGQDPGAQDVSNEADDGTNDQQGTSSEEPAAGPTPVTLPDGETLTAASPQLAAAIKAAVGGTPIAEAFQQQGMTLPPPGTAVPDPIDALQVTPGDIGMFTDRHALALSPGKALLDGQIQHIATVSGPGFLGWEHPPAATAAVATPAKPDPPTPTRPATSSTT